MVKLGKIMTKSRALYLAYDQGLEHGPESDFNDKNVDPLYIIDIARKGKFNGLVFQKGIVEKYNDEIKASGIPLIMKLNGKTKLYKGEPLSAVIGTVDEAVKLGASAVGFTIYIGSEHEERMIEEFEKIEHEAHAIGMPVITWIYPRGKSVKDPDSREALAYAARTGLEIGSDMVKVHWNGNQSDLKWAVKSAGRCKLVVAGGLKTDEKNLIDNVKKVVASGANGLAIGRNIWQNEKPLEITRKIKKILFS